jgi:hypothetical protein
MNRKHHTFASLARSLNLKSTTVLLMFRRPTIQVSKLIKLSKIFEYNFFREIADQLPYAEPANPGAAVMAKERDELTNRIKELEMEVAVLRQTIREVLNK